MNMNGQYNNNYKPQWKKTILRCLLMMGAMAFITWLITGCSDDSDPPVPVDKVLLAYLAGDNNLSGESREKLDALCRGYDGKACQRILIYHDSKEGAACLYEADGKGSYTAVESYGTENSADAAVFSRVLLKAKAMYPNASFNLLVFSHASGWLPEGTFFEPKLRSVLTDGDRQMEFADFAGKTAP